MSELKTILEQFSHALSGDIKSAIPKVTGKTADSVEESGDEFGFEITANASLVTLIDGRRPTGNGAVKGSPSLKETIRQWIEDKGIQPDGISKDSLAFLIARSIHKKGTLLYQHGGKNNLFESIITPQRIDSLAQLITGVKAKELMSEIDKQFTA